MVTEDDFGKPIFYVDGEELDSFLKSNMNKACG